ncbi:hypothetical protein O0L34_g18297 [Tuta absoluta]|nr:hypothetical protein O0L34_g18297 [Tuta absoluta]
MASAKGRAKNKANIAEAKAAAAEMNENLAAFSLPESLPCSEVAFPVIHIQKRQRANWKAILQESENKKQEIQDYEESLVVEKVVKSPFQYTECDYVERDIFLTLLPALEETLNKAKLWGALQNQRCFFSGIDWLVQVLWNNNPLHPERKFANLHLFKMPWVKRYLAEHPRPYYPKSWLWTEDYAATLIQKTVRRYFVQRDEEVQEMRQFWRKLDIERQMPDIQLNPYLSKKFASVNQGRELSADKKSVQEKQDKQEKPNKQNKAAHHDKHPKH